MKAITKEHVDHVISDIDFYPPVETLEELYDLPIGQPAHHTLIDTQSNLVWEGQARYVESEGPDVFYIFTNNTWIKVGQHDR